jgi:hypothetical protein
VEDLRKQDDSVRKTISESQLSEFNNLGKLQVQFLL